MTAADFKEYWGNAHTWDEYLRDAVREHRALWEGVYKTARPAEGAVERLREIGGNWKMLVLSADWCGDASNTVPMLARFSEATPQLEIRILERDKNPELMDRYLTNGARSIPLAILLDDAFRPVAHWGPRPRELQEWVLKEKRTTARPAEEIYHDVRSWYARDRGKTALAELLYLLKRAEPGAGEP